MLPIRPRRSVLYMPASNPRAIEKARTLPVDGVILDLEDAVAPEMKDVARAQAVAATLEGGFGRRETIIRVNAPGSPWYEADLEAAAASRADAILIPKPSHPEELLDAAARLDAKGAAPDMKLWAMVETAMAVLRIDALAGAARAPGGRLACLVIGANDLAKDTRARIVPGRAPMLPWLQQILLAARAHGLDCLDGVMNEISDPRASPPRPGRAATWASTARRWRTRPRPRSSTPPSRPPPKR